MEVWGELSKQRGVRASKISILGMVGSFRIRYMCAGVLGTDLGSLLHVAIGFFFTRFQILIFGFLFGSERKVLGRSYSVIFKLKNYSFSIYSVFVIFLKVLVCSYS